MPNKPFWAILLCVVTLTACDPPAKTSESPLPEPSGNTFVLRDLEPLVVRRAALGDTPCCGFAEQGDGPWGIWLRALGNFPNPPKSPSVQPGTDGIVSKVKSAKIELLTADGETEDVTDHFSAAEHCQSLQHFEGLQTDDFKCFQALEGEAGKYRTWQAGENEVLGQAYSRAEAPKGSKEEMYFRSLHPDFRHYAMAFNDKAQGTRQLGVQVVFWADGDMVEQAVAGDELQLVVEFEDGSTVSAQVTLP